MLVLPVRLYLPSPRRAANHDSWIRVFVSINCSLLVLAATSAWAGDRASRASAIAATLPSRNKPPAVRPEIQARAQQFASLGASDWLQSGYRGQGIKVAILDSGFRGYRNYLGKVLPDKVLVRSFRKDGNLEARDSQHGILCGEVVHALAPEAELLFANWEPEQPDFFLQAVCWAREQGAQVISCSVITPYWSDGEGGGKIHAALRGILGDGTHAGDLLCFASAGNTAQRHWTGLFRAGADGFHEWRPGQTSNLLTPWGSERASAELYWHADADFDLFVYDRDSGREIGHSLAQPGVSRCSAVVHVRPQTGHVYAVRLRQVRGPAARFHVVGLEADLEYSTSPGSISFPADGPEVIAVGAVDGAGHRKDYSACGPNSPKPKPDFVAPVPFLSSWRSRPFAGTSAAAPQAAAVAALWWSGHSKCPADKVREALYASAQDLGPPGHDWETGYGLIHLPKLEQGKPLASALPPGGSTGVSAAKAR